MPADGLRKLLEIAVSFRRRIRSVDNFKRFKNGFFTQLLEFNWPILREIIAIK